MTIPNKLLFPISNYTLKQCGDGDKNQYGAGTKIDIPELNLSIYVQLTFNREPRTPSEERTDLQQMGMGKLEK